MPAFMRNRDEKLAHPSTTANADAAHQVAAVREFGEKKITDTHQAPMKTSLCARTCILLVKLWKSL